MHISCVLLATLFILANLSTIQAEGFVKSSFEKSSRQPPISPIYSKSPYLAPSPIYSSSANHPPPPIRSGSGHVPPTPTSSRSAPYPPTFWHKTSPNPKPSLRKQFFRLFPAPPATSSQYIPPSPTPSTSAYNPRIPTSSRSAPYPPTFWKTTTAHRKTNSRGLPSASSLLADGYETFPSQPTSRYKLYSHPVPWTEALLYCQKDGEGSLLVVIESQAEAGVVKEMFARIQDDSTQYLHVGVNDIYQEGVWMVVRAGLDQPLSTAGYEVWEAGQPDNGGLDQPLSTAGYEVWEAGQPDNGGNGENCGAVNRQVELSDVPCNMFGAPFLCEKPN